MIRKIPDKSYTFSDYFKLNCEPLDIANHFGYKLEKIQFSTTIQIKPLPQEIEQNVGDLKHKLIKRLKGYYFSAEIAKRGVYVDPVIALLYDWLEFKVLIEYSIEVNDRLKGTLDYLITTEDKKIAVIEAKKDDLEKGFSQLIPEMIALREDNEQDIFGVVTTGSSWQFGKLNQNTIYQDIDLYSCPGQLRQIVTIFAAFLTQ
ncbi:hypothetical protein [Pleurocapsa sp. PCC 7319]|uniref:hypothetical protein n=1 Tax=Pleurocapsa sp. PCC 7319 TaxID=118161 RepID=UPI00034CC370|nr:hypothetical protein [Pleurocapsa sp. PCC 7319]